MIKLQDISRLAFPFKTHFVAVLRPHNWQRPYSSRLSSFHCVKGWQYFLYRLGTFPWCNLAVSSWVHASFSALPYHLLPLSASLLGTQPTTPKPSGTFITHWDLPGCWEFFVWLTDQKFHEYSRLMGLKSRWNRSNWTLSWIISFGLQCRK